MAETFSLEEAYAGGAGAPAPVASTSDWKISPVVQAQRDAYGLYATNGGRNDINPEPQSNESLAASRRELESEIKNQKDPKSKAILQEQLNNHPKGGSQTFSLDEAYGTKPEVAKPKSDLDIALGGVAAGVKAIIDPFTPKNLLHEGVAIGDLVLSVPSMMAGAAADTTVRLGAVLRGMPHREASALAAQARQDAGDNPLISPNPLSKALAVFGLEPTETGVGSLMDKLNSAITKGGEYVDKKTGGVLNKDDIESLANMVMATTGGKGLNSGLKSVFSNERPPLPKVDTKVPPSDRIDPTVDSPPPPTEAAPPAPPLDSPHARAKDDIERTMNIPDPEKAAAVRKTRRAQARAAFKDDQKYADYLSKHADEEAGIVARNQAHEESQNGKISDGVQETQGPAQSEEAQARTEGEKINAGRVDPDLLKIMALGGAGAALAYAYPDETKGVAEAAFGVGLLAHGDISKLGDNATFQAVLEKSGTTLKTLERLPQNRSEVSVQSVRETLRRDDVSKSEKEILGSVLDAHPGDSITAKDLVLGFKKATQNFELKEAPSPEYADYGLEAIGRYSEESRDIDEWADASPSERATAASQEVTAKSSIWQLPPEMAGSSSNHFNDPLYFGHTRSFVEGGVKHVVEIQSDVAQHSKTMTPEAREQAKAELTGLEEKIKEAERKAQSMRTPEAVKSATAKAAREVMPSLREGARLEPDGPLVSGLRMDSAKLQPLIDEWKQVKKVQEELQSLAIRHSEVTAEISSGGQNLALLPMMKNWDRRLVREELAATARKSKTAGEAEIRRIEQSLTRWPHYPGDIETGRERADVDIASIKGKMSGAQRVRFATADTVAKVEGWPKRDPLGDAQMRMRKEQRIYNDRIDSLAEYKKIADAATQSKGLSTVAMNAMREAQAADIADRERFLERQKARVEDAKTHLATIPLDAKPSFAPEHQGIYDRYKKDTEKFLRNLGGQLYTDSHGHTWIEVPTKPGAAGRRAEMFGGADLKTLSGIAAAGLGLAFGSYLDSKNPIEGAIWGLLIGGAIGTGAVGKAVTGLKDLAKASKGERITDLTERHETRLKRIARESWQASNEILKMLPKKADRVAVFQAVKNKTVAELKGDQLRGGQWVENYRSRLSAAITNPKVLAAGLDAFDKMALNTIDVAEAVGQFGNALGRAVANQTFMEELRMAETANGPGPRPMKLVQGLKKAPVDYISIDNPQFANVRVHPDIAHSLKFMFENQEPGELMAATSMVNTAIKRTAISFSLFHVKSLLDAGFGAFSHPVTAAKVLVQASVPRIFGVNRFLKQMREGGVGDMVDFADQSGLVYSFERNVAASEDVGGNFYKGMKSVQNMLDRALPWTKGNKGALASSVAGAAAGYALNPNSPIEGAIAGAVLGGGGGSIRALQLINHKMDNLMWGRVHAAFKLEIFAAKTEAIMENNARAGKTITREAAGKIAASYSNYIFGGLNWQRMAEGVESKFGREIALGAFSPGGRRWMQLATFAPDWTISTTMALAKVIGKGDGLRGLFSAKTGADLHRQQLARSAFYYFTVGNAVNYAFTGHYLWDNKDWTRIELGDGRTMQLSKHFTEPFHWAINPGQQGLNKLGIIPREALAQSLNVEYLSAKGHMPPMKEGRTAHLAKSLNPIGVQQFRDGGVSAGLSGMLGVPIYGQTEAQKRDAKMKAALDKYRKAMGIDQ